MRASSILILTFFAIALCDFTYGNYPSWARMESPDNLPYVANIWTGSAQQQTQCNTCAMFYCYAGSEWDSCRQNCIDWCESTTYSVWSKNNPTALASYSYYRPSSSSYSRYYPSSRYSSGRYSSYYPSSSSSRIYYSSLAQKPAGEGQQNLWSYSSPSFSSSSYSSPSFSSGWGSSSSYSATDSQACDTCASVHCKKGTNWDDCDFMCKNQCGQLTYTKWSANNYAYLIQGNPDRLCDDCVAQNCAAGSDISMCTRTCEPTCKDSRLGAQYPRQTWSKYNGMKLWSWPWESQSESSSSATSVPAQTIGGSSSSATSVPAQTIGDSAECQQCADFHCGKGDQWETCSFLCSRKCGDDMTYAKWSANNQAVLAQEPKKPLALYDAQKCTSCSDFWCKAGKSFDTCNFFCEDECGTYTYSRWLSHNYGVLAQAPQKPVAFISQTERDAAAVYLANYQYSDCAQCAFLNCNRGSSWDTCNSKCQSFCELSTIKMLWNAYNGFTVLAQSPEVVNIGGVPTVSAAPSPVPAATPQPLQVSAVPQAQPDVPSLDAFLHADPERMQKIDQEWEQFVNTNRPIVLDEKKKLEDELELIFAQAVQDVNKNYNDMVLPVAESWAKLVKMDQADSKQCNIDCLVSTCFDITGLDLSQQCVFDTCGCSSFLSRTRIEEHGMNHMNLIDQFVQKSHEFLLENLELVQEALENWEDAMFDVHQNERGLVEKQMVQHYGCESECISECSEVKHWFDWTKCIDECKCTDKPFSLTINGIMMLP